MQSKGIKKVTADQLIPFTAMGVNESVQAYEQRVFKMFYLVTATSFNQRNRIEQAFQVLQLKDTDYEDDVEAASSGFLKTEANQHQTTSKMSAQSVYLVSGIDKIDPLPKKIDAKVNCKGKGHHQIFSEGRWTKCRNCSLQICHMCENNPDKCESRTQIAGIEDDGMILTFKLLCPLMHWLRFGVDKDGQRYARCTYWLTIWFVPLTYPTRGIFFILFEILKDVSQ